MRRVAGVCGLVLSLAVAPTAGAQTACGGVYTVQPGDTFSSIAVRFYDDPRKWSSIYYNNPFPTRAANEALEEGRALYIPCQDAAGAPEPPSLQRDDAELRLLTGGGYAPFTDQDLDAGGLITELVNAALEEAPNPVTFSVSWDDDWSQHLYPLLDDKVYDMGFPWLKPDCRVDRTNERCQFHFSQPLFEMLILLFVEADSDLVFQQDSDLHGATLCRPAGYYTHDLDRTGRRWLTEGLVTLVQPDSPQACFDLLKSGDVDGVALNEFLGRLTVHDLGLTDQVRTLDQPISIEGLHVVVSRTHPRGTTFLYRLDAGVRTLKQSRRYNSIVERHLSAYWDQLETPSGSETEDSVDLAVAEAAASDLSACRAAARAWTLVREAGGYQSVLEEIEPLLERAVDGSVPEAETWLGYLHLSETIPEADPSYGTRLLERAAISGSAEASYLMGKAALEGKGVTQSDLDYAYWIVKADEAAGPDHYLREKIVEHLAMIEGSDRVQNMGGTVASRGLFRTDIAQADCGVSPPPIPGLM